MGSAESRLTILTTMRCRTVSLLSVLALLAGLASAIAPAATADHIADPASVAIAGVPARTTAVFVTDITPP